VAGLESGIIFGAGNTYWSSSGFNGRPDFTKLAAWKLNVVRLPVNEDSWLGNSVTGMAGNVITLNGPAYQAEVAATVKAANAAGLYVILDLHWSAPANFIGNVQNPMADADNSVAFWTSVANAFMNNPAVIFELFNEPYFDPVSQADGAFNNVTGGFPNTTANEMIRNGGTPSYYFGLSSGTLGRLRTESLVYLVRRRLSDPHQRRALHRGHQCDPVRWRSLQRRFDLVGPGPAERSGRSAGRGDPPVRGRLPVQLRQRFGRRGHHAGGQCGQLPSGRNRVRR
jgi:hypothetical protein